MEIHQENLVQRLKELRELANLTQEAVSELAGLSYKHYQAVESRRKNNVQLSTLAALAKAYELEPWELLHPDFPELDSKFHSKIQRFTRKRQVSKETDNP